MALIGDKFARNEIFLPAMMLAANVMNAGMSILKIKIEQERIQINYRGKVIIGTVFGDIHDIGKNLVKILLDSQGFQVIDLGVNVKSDVFIKSIKDNKPDILALSALLTTTAPEMGKTIQAIKEANLRDSIKIMIGGAAITEKFAISIGADGYEPTAPLAVKLANEFVNKHN
jgi:methanogenic corrinoid protein MtbC1